MKIIEAHQVPYGNVSPDIFKLPCIKMVSKVSEKNPIPQYWLYKPNPQCWPFALPTDWICKTEDGEWIILDNEEYQRIKNNEKATETTKG